MVEVELVVVVDVVVVVVDVVVDVVDVVVEYVLVVVLVVVVVEEVEEVVVVVVELVVVVTGTCLFPNLTSTRSSEDMTTLWELLVVGCHSLGSKTSDTV